MFLQVGSTVFETWGSLRQFGKGVKIGPYSAVLGRDLEPYPAIEAAMVIRCGRWQLSFVNEERIEAEYRLKGGAFMADEDA